MSIRKRLRRYNLLIIERKQLEEKLGHIAYKIEKPNISCFLCTPPIITATATALDQLAGIADEYTCKLKEVDAELYAIEDILKSLENPLERVVLRARYLDNLSWEEIGEKIGYEWAQVHRIHRKGIESLEKFFQ